MILPVSFFGKLSIGTGTNVAFNLTIIICVFLVGIWLLRMIIFDRRVALVPSPLNAPATALIIVLTLSLGVGNIQWIPQATAKASLSAQFGGWLLYILSICMLLLPGNLIRDIRLLRIMVLQFLILGFIFLYSHLIPGAGKFAALFL